MLLNTILRNYIKHINYSRLFSSSALYVTGDKAQKQFAVLNPIIDFDIKQKSELFDNIKDRNLTSIDINHIIDKWIFYKEADQIKTDLINKRLNLTQQITKLMENKNDDHSKEINKLKMHLKLLKEELKCIKDGIYSIEEDSAMLILSLPNVLNKQTPRINEIELYNYQDKPNKKTPSHMDIGENNFFKYLTSMCCYLYSDAALYEFSIQNRFINNLLNLNYTQFSNCDFVKTVVIEGCGTMSTDNLINKNEILTLENIHCIKSDDLNQLHLVGGSSLYSFMAYFTKYSVQSSYFPLKLFCPARNYRSISSNDRNLFNLNQTSEIELFIVNSNNLAINDIVNELATLYKTLNKHFRIVLLPANRLKNAESLRISVEMYSNYLGNYIEVGNISFYEEYLSKRLLLNYTENNIRKYPKVIGGCLINIHKVLACVIENNFANGQKKSFDI